MVKIRLCADHANELEKAVDFFTSVFPDMRFSAVRLGGNPKYKDDPKYFSYGEPRIKDKKPVQVDFSIARKMFR
jgi:predicted 3-demethylubiquinone-9 3-methyltransferase (glyoxalase superfamily)